MTMVADCWKDRIALVTGASSGIGRAVARSLAQAGMRVVACARRRERLEQLASEVGGPERLFPVVADLRSMQDIDALFRAARDRMGGVDVLINNAGIGFDSALVSGETEHWREMLDINVLALCVCTREAIADMRRRGVDDGYIIHISSMAGHRVPLHSGVYSASKYAVRSLTEGLRQELRELGSGIRVSAISPGNVETEFAERARTDPTQPRQTHPFKVLEDQDIANTVLYLLAQPPHVQVHDVLLRPTGQRN